MSHLEEQLQRDVDRIRDKVREMADLALRALEEAVKALTTGDTKLAYAAILRDSRIDDLESIVENDADHLEVRLGFDIFYSRVNTFTKGEIYAPLRASEASRTPAT